MNRSRSRATRSTRALGGLAALFLVAVTLTACSSDGGGEESLSSGTADAGGSAAEAAPDPAAADSDSAATRTEPVVAQSRALIRTGTVALRADDVAQARFEVQKAVDKHGGEVGEETTSADDDGEAEFARLVVRVPTARFAQTMAELEQVADLISTDTTTEDVTTQVIDTDVRVELQRRSIQRISLLLDRAGGLRDILRIEQELARREADLGSLEQQQAYLADQTSFSTITVSLERPAEKPREKEDTDEAGFVTGLRSGWDAFTTAGTGLLTVAGAVLPFAVLLLVLGAPAIVLLRRRTRRPAPAQAP